MTRGNGKPVLMRRGDRLGVVLSLLAALGVSVLLGWVSVEADRQIAWALRDDR